VFSNVTPIHGIAGFSTDCVSASVVSCRFAAKAGPERATSAAGWNWACCCRSGWFCSRLVHDAQHFPVFCLLSSAWSRSCGAFDWCARGFGNSTPLSCRVSYAWVNNAPFSLRIRSTSVWLKTQDTCKNAAKRLVVFALRRSPFATNDFIKIFLSLISESQWRGHLNLISEVDSGGWPFVVGLLLDANIAFDLWDCCLRFNAAQQVVPLLVASPNVALNRCIYNWLMKNFVNVFLFRARAPFGSKILVSWMSSSWFLAIYGTRGLSALLCHTHTPWRAVMFPLTLMRSATRRSYPQRNILLAHFQRSKFTFV